MLGKGEGKEKREREKVVRCAVVVVMAALSYLLLFFAVAFVAVYAYKDDFCALKSLAPRDAAETKNIVLLRRLQRCPMRNGVSGRYIYLATPDGVPR